MLSAYLLIAWSNLMKIPNSSSISRSILIEPLSRRSKESVISLPNAILAPLATVLKSSNCFADTPAEVARLPILRASENARVLPDAFLRASAVRVKLLPNSVPNTSAALRIIVTFMALSRPVNADAKAMTLAVTTA